MMCVCVSVVGVCLCTCVCVSPTQASQAHYNDKQMQCPVSCEYLVLW